MAKTVVRGVQIADGANGVDLTVDVFGTLPVANGGTGVASPGGSGNVLTSNGTSWVSSAPVTSTTITKNTQTANYTLVAADAGVMVEMNSGAATTVTIPTGLPVNAVYYIEQYGSGQVTVVPAAGVTLHWPSSAATRTQFSTLMLWCRATNEYILSGDAL